MAVNLLKEAWSKINPYKIYVIDNYTSRLFYQVTFAICLTATGFIGGQSIGIGKSIECDGTNTAQAERECWDSGTKRCNTDPCLKSYNCNYDTKDDKLVLDQNMAWYKWNSLILLFNALVFRISHEIWKRFEGDLISNLLLGVSVQREGRIIVKKHSADENESEENQAEVDEVLRRNSKSFIQNRHKYQRYYAMFVFSQFLNILVVIGIFFFNSFIFKGINKGFLSYGKDVLDPENNIEGEENTAMCNMFPTRKTTCLITGGSEGGSSSSGSTTCTLNQNVYNQIIYLILWFLYCTLMIVGVFQLFFEAATYYSRSLRKFLIKKKLGKEMAKNDETNDILSDCLDGCTIGDWFVLYQIGKNMNKKHFMQFLRRVAEQMPRTEEETPLQENINNVA